jgi:hypothetical protein
VPSPVSTLAIRLMGKQSAILVTLSILWAGVASATTFELTPRPGLVESAAFRVDFSGFTVPYANGPNVLGSSTIDVDFEEASRVLTLSSISLHLDFATVFLGVHAGYCLNDMSFSLPVGDSAPQATVGPDGHFETSFGVVYRFRVSTDFYCASYAPESSLTATWHVSGTFQSSPTPSLTDTTVAVDGSSNPFRLLDGTLVLNFWSGFGLYEPTRKVQRVGDPISLTGAGITPGSVLKLFIRTDAGTVDVSPGGILPTATTPNTWDGVLPWPWPVGPPHDFDLGFGFMFAILVRTDRGYDHSNGVTRFLTGNPDLGVPSLTSIDGNLSPTGWDPAVAVANVETVLVPGSFHFLGGSFDQQDDVVNVFSAAGNCAPPGGVIPTQAGSNFLGITIPASCPTGPGALQVVNRRNYRTSNILSVPIGALVTISNISLTGDVVTVTGTGF